MNDKFKYAPGLPGYGTIGKDGSAGLSGLATYFSEFDGVIDQVTIKSRIIGNQVLFGPGDPLPGFPERVYQQGDIFIDINARIYEIDFTQANRYHATGIFLNTSGYFELLKPSQNGLFNRYTNNRTAGNRVLIDAVQTITGVGDYTLIPTSIYGDSVSNFTTVTHTNIGQGVENGYNLLNIWKGDLVNDNNDALALVKTTGETEYRLGNLDASENLRNTTLVLDLSAVRISKDKGGDLDNEAPLGSVLTNREINTNFLFDPNFNMNPASFDVNVVDASTVVISWDKRDFVNTHNPSILNNIKADLYFYNKRFTTYNGRKFNATDPSTIKEFKPFIFVDVDPSGSITIDGLKPQEYYRCHLKFYEHGWVRQSVIKEFQSGVLAALDIIPSTWNTWSGNGEIRHLEVSSNVNWSAFTDPAVSWVHLNPVSGIAPGDTIDVSVAHNPTYYNRNTSIKVVAGNQQRTITVYQTAQIKTLINFMNITHNFTQNFSSVSADLGIMNLESGCDVSVYFICQIEMNLPGIFGYAQYRFYKNGSLFESHQLASNHATVPVIISGISNTDNINVYIEVYINSTDPDSQVTGSVGISQASGTCARPVEIAHPGGISIGMSGGDIN